MENEIDLLAAYVQLSWQSKEVDLFGGIGCGVRKESAIFKKYMWEYFYNNNLCG